MQILGLADSTALLLGTRRAGEGVYQVSIATPGYAPWVRTNVVVRSTHCGPVGVALNALMQR